MRRARLARALARIAAGAALLLGCKDDAPKRAPAKASHAARVVSLTPSTTEALFAVGAGASLVGRSRYCDFPKEVLALPQVGGFVDPSLEAILGLHPDLVIGARGPAGSRIKDQLATRGIATYFPETRSIAAIEAMILGLGERTAHRDDAARRVEEMRARIRAVSAAVAPLPRARVMLVFGVKPLSVAGPESFADEMIRRAGGANVVTEGGNYPTLGAERVLALDPDVIVNAAFASNGKVSLGPGTPGWANVRAVREHHVVRLADESVLRPGPRVADGLAQLARAIHPGVVIPAAGAPGAPTREAAADAGRP